MTAFYEEPDEAKNTEKKESEITNPIQALEISYEEFVMAELEKQTGEVKAPLFLSITDDVDKQSVSYGIIESHNRTFEYNKCKKDTVVVSPVLNGIFEKVQKLKEVPNNKTEHYGEATIHVQVRTDKGRLTSPFVLNYKAKTKSQDFAEAINKASNYLIFSGNDGTLKLLRELMNNRCSETINLLPNSGSIDFEDLQGRLYENVYTDGKTSCWADDDGVITLPTKTKVMLNKSLRNQLPRLDEKKSAENIPKITNDLLTSMNKGFNGAIGPFLALGLGVMGIYANKLWDTTCGFPVGFLYGASKQGKGTMQNIISHIYGFNKNFSAMGNSSVKSATRKSNLYNDTMLMLNDMNSKTILRDSFEDTIVQAYECVTREKMLDGNRFNNLPMCSPLFISSNYLPVQKEKILNRLLPVYFERNSFNPEAVEKYYNSAHYLSLIIPELIKNDCEQVFEKIKEVEEYLIQKACIIKTRESHNLAVAYTGLLLLESLGLFKLDEQDAKLLAYFDWYLDQFKELEEPIDSFLNNLPMMIEENHLISDLHISLREVKDKIELTLRTSYCLNQFNLHIGRLYPDVFVQPKDFMVSVKNSPYFIKNKNVRYKTPHKRIPPIANSLVLDITEHFCCDEIKSACRIQARTRQAQQSQAKQ